MKTSNEKRDIILLSKWLVTKGCTSLLKIQKLLFFIRYEELANNEIENSYFDQNNNFQAWIYGPVSYKSFEYLQPWFNKENEPDMYYLTDQKEIELIDKKYNKYYEKYEKFSPSELVEKSHKNLAWIKARNGFGSNEICREFMNESNEDFITFID